MSRFALALLYESPSAPYFWVNFSATETFGFGRRSPWRIQPLHICYELEGGMVRRETGDYLEELSFCSISFERLVFRSVQFVCFFCLFGQQRLACVRMAAVVALRSHIWRYEELLEWMQTSRRGFDSPTFAADRKEGGEFAWLTEGCAHV